MNLVWITLIGLAVGLVARLVTAGKKGPFGFMLTILLGIIGAFVGLYLGQEVGWYSAEAGITSFFPPGACHSRMTADPPPPWANSSLIG